MSGNSHDRRVDARGLNYTQRVFDCLQTAGRMLTVAELAVLTNMDDEAVRGTLSRLRAHRALRSLCADGQWTYGLRAGVERPEDRRGKRKAA